MIDALSFHEKVHDSDTIAAISTPLVPSAIGIIRVSGTKTLTVIEHIFKDTPSKVRDRYIKTCHAMDQDDNILDECCYAFYKNPKS